MNEWNNDSSCTVHRIAVHGARDDAGGGTIYCEEDNYTDGWRFADTVLMLHGIAERAEIWRPWVPYLAREHRILRPDLRGFGRSSELPDNFTIADWADDIQHLLTTLHRSRVHIIATKLGALVAFELAQRRPDWLLSMTLAGMLPSPAKSLGPWIEEWLAMVEGHGNGVQHWAEATMPGRMGSTLPAEATQWWAKLMGTAPATTVAACFRLLPHIPGPANPERVLCPTLFLVPGTPETNSSQESYNQRPAASDLEQLASRVPGARLKEVPADSYHIAATHPDACAMEAALFIQQFTHKG